MTNTSQPSLSAAVRITDMADMLAGLPVLFGFRPERSLILLSLDGDRGRVGFRLRVDLPPVELAEEVADYLVAVLDRNSATRVLLIACSDQPAVADPTVRVLVERLGAAGVTITDAVRCDGERYWSYLCDNPDCCPPRGREYDAASGRLLAEAVLSGMEILPDRAALAARVGPVAGAERSRMERATADAAAAMGELLGEGGPAAAPPDIDGVVRRLRDIVDTALADPAYELSDADAATLSVWCAFDPVRDTALCWITPADADAHLRVWGQIARKVVPPYESTVLALVGLSAWLSGDGASAWCAIERADTVEPRDPLIEMLRTILVEAIPPSAWGRAADAAGAAADDELDEVDAWEEVDEAD